MSDRPEHLNTDITLTIVNNWTVWGELYQLYSCQKRNNEKTSGLA